MINITWVTILAIFTAALALGCFVGQFACDGYTDPEPLTGYEPNRIVDKPIINEQEDITCTEDNHITEIEGHVKSFSCIQSLLSSTQDSRILRV